MAKQKRNSRSGRSASRKKRVFVVDDHPVVRQGLAGLIEQESDLEICGEAEDVPQALKLLRDCKADLVIADLSLKHGSGLELITEIRIRFKHLPVLMLSMHDELVYAERVIKAGASGYIMKSEEPEQVIAAIRQVLGGSIYVSDRMASRILRGFAQGRSPESVSSIALLSDREFEVFQLIARGMGTRQVAETLHLSVKTIDTHRQHIKAKLGFKDASELTHFAISWIQSAHFPDNSGTTC